MLVAIFDLLIITFFVGLSIMGSNEQEDYEAQHAYELFMKETEHFDHKDDVTVLNKKYVSRDVHKRS